MKRMICGLSVFMAIFVLSACNNSSKAIPSNSTQSETKLATEIDHDETKVDATDEKKVDATDVKISFMVQEYIGDNIAEIPYFEVDGTSSSVIDSINRSLNQGIRQIYDEFMERNGEDSRGWIEIKSYPFTSQKYLQVITTYCTYPTYGTQGELFSINYSKTGGWINAEEALEKLGTDKETILQEVAKRFKAEASNGVLDRAEIAGFLIREEPYSLVLLLKMYIKSVDNESYDTFYSYNTADGSFKEFYSDELSLLEPDKTDPPLYYMKQMEYEEMKYKGVFWGPDIPGYIEYEDGRWGPAFPDNVIYSQEYELQGDPGEGLSAQQAAASQVVHALESIYPYEVLEDKGEISITLIGMEDVSEKSCYLFQVTIGSEELMITVAGDGETNQL